MINGITSSLAGICVHQKKINTTAHNVANVNTDGFKRDRVTIQSNLSGLPEASVTRMTTPGPVVQGPEGKVEKSNVDPAREMVDLMIGKNGFLVNLRVLEIEEETADSVLDILA